MSRPADHLAHFATATWIEVLSPLMLPHERIDLSATDCDALLEHATGIRRPLAFSATLKADLAQVMADFPEGAHIRLEGCSLRAAGQVPHLASAEDAIQALSCSNARVAGCQTLLKPHLREQAIYLFPWTDIPQTHEFRVIVRDRRVLGITPYHGMRGFDAVLHAQLPRIEATLLNFATEIATLAPQPSFAADLFLDTRLAPRLIELNPLGPTTDMGLLGRDFDGRLRYPAPPPSTQEMEDIWRI